MKPEEIRAALNKGELAREAILAHMKTRGLIARIQENVWHYMDLSGRTLDDGAPQWLWLEINCYDAEEDLLEDYFEKYMENNAK